MSTKKVTFPAKSQVFPGKLPWNAYCSERVMLKYFWENLIERADHTRYKEPYDI